MRTIEQYMAPLLSTRRPPSTRPTANEPSINDNTIRPEQFDIAESEEFCESSYAIIQTYGGLDNGELSELRNKGAVGVSPLNAKASLCHCKSSDLKNVRGLPFVKFAVIYLPRLKIWPSLNTAMNETLENGSPVKILILLHEDSPSREVAADAYLSKAERKTVRFLPVGSHKLFFAEVCVDTIRDLACVDTVKSMFLAPGYMQTLQPTNLLGQAP